MLAKLKSIIPTVNKCRIADFSSLNFVKRGRETYLYICNTGHKMYAVQQRGRSKEQDYFVHVIIWIKSLKFLLYFGFYIAPFNMTVQRLSQPRLSLREKVLRSSLKELDGSCGRKCRYSNQLLSKGSSFFVTVMQNLLGQDISIHQRN